ncbi:MAG: hypothetical protein QG610_320, partial [Euryarchaeota archaeon]|nr:hypothetical protein [Euryarchaeota archaeon]
DDVKEKFKKIADERFKCKRQIDPTLNFSRDNAPVRSSTKA